MLRATEVQERRLTEIQTKPVQTAQGVTIHGILELTVPLDVDVRGCLLRMPAGVCISIRGGGTGGIRLTIESDIYFVGQDGREWRLPRGVQGLAGAV